MEYKIFSEAKALIADYQTRPVTIMEGLEFRQHQAIKTAEFYSNSKYLFGNQDELQRDKPFYNIVNYRVTLAKVATDLDIKDVQIGADDPNHYVHAMLLQKEAYEWMKATNFSQFLNEFGQTRPKYGGVLVKRTFELDNDGEEKLIISVVDWRNVATDQVDILSGAIVETHYMTPVDLMMKDGSWENVRDAIEEAMKDQGKPSQWSLETEQHNTDRIVVREITGQFPKSYMNEVEEVDDLDDDDFTYTLQHYFIADVNGKAIVLFHEEMKQEDYQYMYLAWEKMPGRALGRGVIEDAEEAQVWTNDAVINEKNAMDLAGKVVIKTDSKNLGGNILEVDNGRMFELERGEMFDSVSLEPAALGEFGNQIQRWQSQANDATSSYDANSGKQPPADTPYSQTALLNQVAAKPFDYRREEAGIFITEMFENWVIPYLVKRLYKSHRLTTDFTQDELEIIDDAFATFMVNQKVDEVIFGTQIKIVTHEQYLAAIDTFKQSLSGTRRYLMMPKGFFKDIEANVTVLTTGEQKNKAAILQSLSTIMGDVMKTYDPQSQSFAILNNPVMARIFGTILELSGAGISPVSLGIGKPASGAAPGGMPPAPTASPAGQPPAPLSAPINAGGMPSALTPASVQNAMTPTPA